MNTLAWLIHIALLLTAVGCAATNRDLAGSTERSTGPPLLITIEHPASDVVAGDRVPIQLEITNISTGPVNLPCPEAITQFIATEAQGQDHTVLRIRHTGIALGHGKYPGGALQPSDTMRVIVWHIFPLSSYYELKCILDTRPEACPWLTDGGKYPWIWPLWQGRVESKPAIVRVGTRHRVEP